MPMAKLIILRGNSGSGKTTVAKELQKKFGRNTMRISQDVVRIDMLIAKDDEALPLMKELLKYGNIHSHIVILEGILDADKYKSLFELAVQLYDTEIYSYYFDITFEETLKRHKTKPNCNDFGEADMRRWWKEKDYSEVLKESIITDEQDLQSIIQNIYSSVIL